MKTSIKIRRKICIFPKGLVDGFLQKYQISLSLLFGRSVGWEKVFGDVLERKLAFVDYENVDYKKS